MVSCKSPHVSVLGEAIQAELRAARYHGRHAKPKSRRPYRATVAIAGVGVLAAIAASGATSWNAATTPATLAADSRSTPAQPSVLTGSGGQSLAAVARAQASASTQAAAVKAAPSAARLAPRVPVAKPTAASKAQPRPAGPTEIYDSVNPAAIPSGKAVAVYANGAYEASGAAIAGRSNVMWIDVHGTNTNANALDVEPGDATPAEAAAWVEAKLTKDPSSTAVVYTFKADWGTVQADINALPDGMSSHVKYWIADPTGVPHILPGAAATQWFWGANYDITQATPGFFPAK